MKKITNKNDDMDFEHYAVLIFKSQNIFDRHDERNDRYIYYIDYIQFTKIEELQNWILYNSNGVNYKVINVRPVKIETKIEVKIKEK